MRDEIVIALVIVLIIASAGAGYYVGHTNQLTITSTSYTTYTAYTPIVTAGCGIPSDLYVPLLAPATANSSEHGQLAVVMMLDSNATILVGYCPFGTSGPETLSPAVEVESCFKESGESGCQGTPAKDVTIIAVPNQTVFENQSLAIVAYHVSADMNSTGYYIIGIPHLCPSVGLAVGYSANQLNHTDFPWMGPIPCFFSYGEVMKVVGANITYVGLGTS